MLVLVTGSASDSHLLVQALLCMEEPVSAACATTVCTGMQLLQMNPNTAYSTQQWKEMVAWPGTGKLRALVAGQKTREAEVFLSGQMEVLLLPIP